MAKFEVYATATAEYAFGIEAASREEALDKLSASIEADATDELECWVIDPGHLSPTGEALVA